jgi:hypothetical protein
LPTNRDDRAKEQYYCYPFTTGFPAIFALFFIAIGGALNVYGVDQGSKIDSWWPVLIIFGALPAFAVASWLLFEGIFGWDVRHVSTSCNRSSENIRIEPVVVAELKLRNVERQIFRSDFVEGANHAALEDRSKTFNRIGVDSADNVLTASMVDSGVGEVFVKVLIADPLIGAEQANFGGNGFADELSERRSLHILDDAGDHVTLAANSASNDSLTGPTSGTTAATLADMPVLGFAADRAGSGNLHRTISGVSA